MVFNLGLMHSLCKKKGLGLLQERRNDVNTLSVRKSCNYQLTLYKKTVYLQIADFLIQLLTICQPILLFNHHNPKDRVTDK